MSRKQIEIDFRELYVGQNQRVLVENYYKKKKKDMIYILAAGLLILLLLFIKEMQEGRLENGGVISRNEYGEGTKEVELEVKPEEGSWQEFSFSLKEKEYTREELEESFTALVEILPELILGENESTDQITSDLELPVEVEGYPFYLSWESSEPELIDNTGCLEDMVIPEPGQIVELTVFMEYQEWSQEHGLFIRVMPVKKSQIDIFLDSLQEAIEQQEVSQRQEKDFILPKVLQNTELQWRYKRSGTVAGLGILFLFLLPFLASEKDREIHKMAVKRRESLQNQYPEFVSKVILFMEAGMNIKGALFRIAEDYERKKEKGKKQEFLYEELLYICRQLKNGMPEGECYELFGIRCGLPIYRKMSALFAQHLRKGSKDMLETLRLEAKRANEERKNYVKRLGEEAGTKLLFPMIIMLAIVMILIIVPACYSFQV